MNDEFTTADDNVLDSRIPVNNPGW